MDRMGAFSKKNMLGESDTNLVRKMEKFSNMVSQQLERNYLESPKNKKLHHNLDYVEIEIRLAEFEGALNAYRDVTSTGYWGV